MTEAGSNMDTSLSSLWSCFTELGLLYLFLLYLYAECCSVYTVLLSRADFQIDTPNRIYYLYAENAEDMHRWVDVLNRAKKFFEIHSARQPARAEIRADPTLFVDETPGSFSPFARERQIDRQTDKERERERRD